VRAAGAVVETAQDPRVAPIGPWLARAMTDPRPLPPLPQPFGPAPRALRAGQGCGRGPLIGCGVLVVLFGIGAVALSFRMSEVTVWLFEKIEEQVATRLPQDLTPAERARLDAAFEGLYRGIERGWVQQAAVSQLQSKLMSVVRGGNRLDREQVRELTEALELAGLPPMGAGPTPTPTPRAPRGV
jgi:hypothetical protein